MDLKNDLSLAFLSRPPVEGNGESPPALLLMHGFGSNEEDLMGLAPYLDPRLHIISVRAPFTLGQLSYCWYELSMLPNGDFLIDHIQLRRSLERVLGFLDEIIETYGLDPARLFVGGFSQGAILSCATLLTAPEKVAGVVAMSGRWPELPDNELAEPDRLAEKPVIVVHGLFDQVISIEYGRDLKEKLAAFPVELTYEEFQMPHSVNEKSLARVSQWLTDQLDRLNGTNREA